MFFWFHSKKHYRFFVYTMSRQAGENIGTGQEAACSVGQETAIALTGQLSWQVMASSESSSGTLQTMASDLPDSDQWNTFGHVCIQSPHAMHRSWSTCAVIVSHSFFTFFCSFASGWCLRIVPLLRNSHNPTYSMYLIRKNIQNRNKNREKLIHWKKRVRWLVCVPMRVVVDAGHGGFDNGAM